MRTDCGLWRDVGGLSLFNTLCGINGFLINTCKFNWARQVGVVNKKPLYRGVLSYYRGQPVKLSQYFIIPHITLHMTRHVSPRIKYSMLTSLVVTNNYKCIYLPTPVTSFDSCHQLLNQMQSANKKYWPLQPFYRWKDKILRLCADFKLTFTDCTFSKFLQIKTFFIMHKKYS